MKTPKRILVAFDGSKAAMEAVRYLSHLSALTEAQVVLLHIFSPLPDYYWDMEGYSDPVLYSERLSGVLRMERESRETIESRLERAKGILTAAGYGEGAVEIRIVDRKQGFARDILDAAREGFDLLFIGRKGLSNMAPCLLGGVTMKLMQNIDFISLVLVGQSPSPHKALIALDGSPCASRALSLAGTLLMGSDSDLTLIHVVRGQGAEGFLEVASEWGKEIFASAQRTLSGGKLKTKILSGERSRSEAIVHEAEVGGYGTIVVGRKGLSDVKHFYTGRVCHKIANMAANQAVWICN